MQEKNGKCKIKENSQKLLGEYESTAMFSGGRRKNDVRFLYESSRHNENNEMCYKTVAISNIFLIKYEISC